MTVDNTWLLGHRRNVYSQAGEDGVVEKALEMLPARDRWCVEFGAWDGRHLSNTRHLIESGGYRAVLIEGDPVKFQELRRNYAGNDAVVALNRFVGFGPADGLDTILRATPAPRDFDFLSVDIDGNDYHVWAATTEFRPKVVCVEFNPTIPTDVVFVQPADPGVNQGCSLRALADLGKTKNYELVAVLPFNAVFVRAEDFSRFGIADNRPETLWVDREHVTYLFSGYDGTLFLRGNRTLPWHGAELDEAALQPLPARLRKYPGDYGKVDRLLARFFTRPQNRPKRAVRWLLQRLLP